MDSRRRPTPPGPKPTAKAFPGPAFRLVRVWRVLLAPLAAFHVCLPVLVALACLLLSFLNPPFSSLMLDRRLRAGQPARAYRFVPLRRVPRYARLIFVSLEDNTFFQHPGVEPRALRDAWRVNRQLGYIYRGGSTITMQLARTLFLSQERTYLRKYLEILIALEMDLLLPKDRILELYLNTIEFGQGVYGIGAAARHHFGRPAAALGRDEYRRLAALVASPLRYDLDSFLRRRALRERYQFLLRAFPDPSGGGVEAGVVVPETQGGEALPQPPEQAADP